MMPEPEPEQRLAGGGRLRPALRKTGRVAMLEQLPSARDLLESSVIPPTVGGDDLCDDVCDDMVDPTTPPAVFGGATPPAVGGGEGGDYGYVRALVHLEDAEQREDEEPSAGMAAWHMDGRLVLGPMQLPLSMHLEHTDWSGRGACVRVCACKRMRVW